MKLILPLVTPLIKYVQYHAYPLSIAGVSPFFKEWAFNHYINLFSCSLRTKFRLDFINPPAIEVYSPLLLKQIPREFIANFNITIIDFLMNSIKQGFYVYLHLNESYISNSQLFGSSQNCHDILVNGFDRSKSIFFVSGYDKSKHFSAYHAKFEEIEEAYLNVIFDKERLSMQLNDIFLIKLNEEIGQQPPFISLKLIKENLKKYINGDTLGAAISNKINYGCNIYDDLIAALINKTARIKNFQALHEHKVFMRLRIEYLKEKNYIKVSDFLVDSFKKLETDTLIIKNLFMKSELTKKDSAQKIIGMINNIHLKERTIIEELVNLIDDKGFVKLDGNYPSRSIGSINQYH